VVKRSTHPLSLSGIVEGVTSYASMKAFLLFFLALSSFL
jgi:hypothetical protein